MGVRIAFVDDWEFKATTSGCQVLPSHTSRAITDHITQLLKSFFPDLEKLIIFSCHDGATDIKTFELLKVNSTQHCTSHGLHLLLTTDSINKLENVTTVFSKCRNIVKTLHFKLYL